jgi:hypothetical protein
LSSHFAHYVKRVITEPDYLSPSDPYFAEHQPEDQGFTKPTYHAAPKNSGVAARVRKGDTIWLFSQLQSRWGPLPPALDAVIVVGSIQKPHDCVPQKYRFSADECSCWMPLYDASALLAKIWTINSTGKSSQLISGKLLTVGQALRFMRQIDDPSPLLLHKQQVEAIPADFVSYRLIDGTQDAFSLVAQLVRHQRTVWWDRWSLPRRIAERREFFNHHSLNQHIKDAICTSRVVHGICTPKYSEQGSYSETERDIAVKLKKYIAHTFSSI